MEGRVSFVRNHRFAHPVRHTEAPVPCIAEVVNGVLLNGWES
jgi:hypothetical protein